MILLLLIYSYIIAAIACGSFVFSIVVLSAPSSFAIISLTKRELFALV